MAKGIGKSKANSGTEDCVWVEYDDDPTRQYEMPVSQYVELGYQPAVEKLSNVSTSEFRLPDSHPGSAGRRS